MPQAAHGGVAGCRVGQGFSREAVKSIGKSWDGVPQTAGCLGGPGELPLRGVTVPGDDNRLLHDVDAVTLHQVLEQVKDLLRSGTLEGKNPLPRLAAAAALEGEEVGVVAVAAQAEVGPPDRVPLVSVQDELRLCQLHDPRSQLVAFIVHVRYLKFAGVVVWDAVSAQTTAAAPHDVSRRGNPIRQLFGCFYRVRGNSHYCPSISFGTSWRAGVSHLEQEQNCPIFHLRRCPASPSGS